MLQIAKTFKVSINKLILGDLDDTDAAEELLTLKNELTEKDDEINRLRKKVIDLYDKLGM